MHAANIDETAMPAFTHISCQQAPIMRLHIGENWTAVESGAETESGQALLLKIGASRTSSDFFKHNPPAPLEIENAIMVVEDEVMRAREAARGGTRLYSTDELVDDMARIAGCTDALMNTLTLEQVEELFNQLAARSEGRPASQVAIPDEPRFAASLLILREFMHHLHFDSIQVQRHTASRQP